MKKGLLIGLGALGLLAFLGSASKAGATVSPTTPPAPPPPPPPKPPAPPTVPKKPKPPAVDIGPATIEETPTPSGWIPTKPTPQIEQIRSDIQQKMLGSKAGTSFPFQVGGKNYLAMVVMDSSGSKQIAILQPEDQI